MKHKRLMIKLLLLFIISFCYLILTISSATPTTRGLIKNSNKEKLLFQEYLKSTHEVKEEEMIHGENFEIEEGFFEGRMDFEKTDYSGVGANPEHDPKPPGKV